MKFPKSFVMFHEGRIQEMKEKKKYFQCNVRVEVVTSEDVFIFSFQLEVGLIQSSFFYIHLARHSFSIHSGKIRFYYHLYFL